MRLNVIRVFCCDYITNRRYNDGRDWNGSGGEAGGCPGRDVASALYF